jgi:hypothetical protein
VSESATFSLFLRGPAKDSEKIRAKNLTSLNFRCSDFILNFSFRNPKADFRKSFVGKRSFRLFLW